MTNLTAHVRLRPIRFGFLVKPDDANSLLQVLRVNTCLWGGRFNPIIPHLRTVPRWWERHGYRFESAKQIVNGYLDFFEPDFLVESVPGLAEGIAFDSKRVVPLSDMLRRQGDHHTHGHGEDVMGLYRDLYRKVFQFARRHDHDIVNVTAETPSLAAAAACIGGGFPEEQSLAYFGQAFVDAFEPRPIALNGLALCELYQKGFTSALRLGHHGINRDRDGWHDPAMFVFDALSPIELIDLWNLRTVRESILPIPMQWLPELSAFCRQTITENHRPIPGNPHGVMIRETVMFGRAIPSDAIDQLYGEHLRVDVDGANVRQDWYPPLWQLPSARGPRERRATVSGARKTFHAAPASSELELQFDCLHPEWTDEYGSEFRWANVVTIEDWTARDRAATVFPNARARAFVPRLGIGEHRLSTREGIVIFPKYKNIPERWELPQGDAAIAEWLKVNGVTSVSSDAGRITSQIVETLGGFHRVGDIANRGVVTVLDEMSRRPITHSAHHQKFRNQIEEAVRANIWRGRSFETLVDRNAVQVGLEVRCTNCSSWSWFPLDQLDYELRCSLCLRATRFPSRDPGKSENARWAYRVVGPFALPDYAKGGYASALALRCLATIVGGYHRAQVTWCAGREMALSPDRKVEADLVMWYQRKAVLSDGEDAATDVVFGEAKSFGRERFTSDDVAGLRALAERFPGAVLVFATMKQPGELSRSEKEPMRKLALWGRERISRGLATRAPVVVLTGVELFASFSLDEAWKEAGGLHAQFAQAQWSNTDNLRVLADFTQQLYLDLPSYSAWHQAKWATIHARRKARAEARRTVPQANGGAS